MAKKIVTKEDALQRLSALCSRSEQCEYDVNRKMLNWGISLADRVKVLEFLIDNRYVDDTRFAKSFANDKAKFSSWGPYKIKLELSKKRIKPDVISEAIKKIDNRIWREGLMKCAIAKARNLDLCCEESWQNRQKLYKYLISRGFPSSSSGKIVSFIINQQNNS